MSLELSQEMTALEGRGRGALRSTGTLDGGGRMGSITAATPGGGTVGQALSLDSLVLSLQMQRAGRKVRGTVPSCRGRAACFSRKKQTAAPRVCSLAASLQMFMVYIVFAPFSFAFSVLHLLCCLWV